MRTGFVQQTPMFDKFSIKWIATQAARYIAGFIVAINRFLGTGPNVRVRVIHRASRAYVFTWHRKKRVKSGSVIHGELFDDGDIYIRTEGLACKPE